MLTNDPGRCEYFRQSSRKGIRANFFITNFSETLLSDINGDNNGTYLKSGNTNKLYYFKNDRTNIVHEVISGKFYYNER